MKKTIFDPCKAMHAKFTQFLQFANPGRRTPTLKETLAILKAIQKACGSVKSICFSTVLKKLHDGKLRSGYLDLVVNGNQEVIIMYCNKMAGEHGAVPGLTLLKAENPRYNSAIIDAQMAQLFNIAVNHVA